ncbi:type II toxin-antitoxin system RelE/ParE family toxin [Adlercreutzia sp. ZJ242]|uniref:type II toxin-antitoxin system RelE family toxin n=1 Tax=Adlercreutzia sp. ZJ242 TaxID=2709409 RepID=UPI0013EDA93B|nr:addiction module toxin RelE [Adlercreutzia sp. ZJ242]
MTSARFKVEFFNGAARKEYLALDGSARAMVDKGIARLALRADEIGKPLAGKLAGCKELKLRASGIRIVFRLREGRVEVVQIIVIDQRDKGKVFTKASRRLERDSEDGSEGGRP